MEINRELNRIQKELKAPKSQRNDFGKYNYRNAEDILEAYKKVAGYTSLLISDEIVLVGERYYVKATATLMFDKETLAATAYAREALDKKGMDEAQITGAASSYARKYALNALFAIDDTKDADSQDNSKQAPVITDALRKRVADAVSLDELKTIWSENKGLGKEFSQIVTEQKKFILSVQTSEEAEIH